MPMSNSESRKHVAELAAGSGGMLGKMVDPYRGTDHPEFPAPAPDPDGVTVADVFVARLQDAASDPLSDLTHPGDVSKIGPEPDTSPAPDPDETCDWCGEPKSNCPNVDGECCCLPCFERKAQ